MTRPVRGYFSIQGRTTVDWPKVVKDTAVICKTYFRGGVNRIVYKTEAHIEVSAKPKPETQNKISFHMKLPHEVLVDKGVL